MRSRSVSPSLGRDGWIERANKIDLQFAAAAPLDDDDGGGCGGNGAAAGVFTVSRLLNITHS